MIRTIVALAIFSLIAAIPAAAQPDDWPKSVWKKARKDRAAKRARARHKRIHTHRITTGSIRKRAGLQPQQCVAAVSVVGDQAASTSGAKSQAEKAWQQQVRFLNGELYSDPRNAGDISFRCVDSSIRNFANRATEVVGINSQLKRCSMTAVPCRAPKVFEVGR
jgi:hypothetical protein